MFDAYELNKIAGAILFTALLLLVISIIGENLFHVSKPATPGYGTEVAEAEGKAEEEKAEPETVPLAELLANADADKGEKVAKKCASCHTFNEGGAKKVGPNLHGIVGRELASGEGFAYSAALKEKGGTWTYEELNAFVAQPKNYIPGTAMAFAGIKKAKDRADLILYLKSVSPNAPELP